jgi:hypothetical protein
VIQYGECPLRAGKIGLQASRLLADGFQRFIELCHVHEDHEQFSERKDARLHIARADEKNRGSARRSCGSNQQPEGLLSKREPNPRAYTFR